MNNNKSSLSFKNCFDIASTQFASILGPGVASGATVLAMFASRGWHGAWLTFFGVAISFIGYYFAMEYGRLHDIRNYADLYKGLYGRFHRVATPLMDFAVAYATFVGMAIVTAQFGSLMVEWGLPYFVGVGILWIFGILGSIFGTDVFRKIQGFLSIVLLILTLIINISCIANGVNILKEILSTRWMPEDSTLWTSIFWAFQYGFVQVQMITVLIPNLDIIRKKSDIKKSLGIGYVMNMLLVGVQSIALLAFMPGVLGLNVPFLEITKQIFPGWGAFIYQISLALAIYTTAVSYCFTIGSRYSKLMPKAVEQKVARAGIPVSIFVIAAVIVSQIGVMAIYNKLAPTMGYMNFLFLFLPLLILAPIAISKKRKELTAQGMNPDEGDFISEA